MSSHTLEFWYEFASTYSYLSALRIEEVARAAGVRLAWRPFLLGPIFAAQGWNDSPFNLYPAKGRYMWRDMERLSARHALPFQRPSVFPRSALLAARVALVAFDQGFGEDWTRAVYSAEFGEDRDIGSRDVVVALLEALEQNPAAVLLDAEAPANKERLRSQSERARELGIFGAPSFVVGGELYWGNDRLGDAIAHARLGGA